MRQVRVRSGREGLGWGSAGGLVGLAVDLARAVAEMHRRGVMHRDIAPANIVVSAEGTSCLVDFAPATLVAEVRPDFTHHSEIVGTLAYLAPEQTGRTGRSVDERADLYALGATLYELATGEPPFGSGDPLRVIHDHLARVPVPPAQVNPAVPGAVSEIVMHLLEKEPHRPRTPRSASASSRSSSRPRSRTPTAASSSSPRERVCSWPATRPVAAWSATSTTELNSGSCTPP
jgi:serine/threonine protein kinase